MDIWITSDTHFAHENIIRYCARPFKNASHMDEMMNTVWRERVKDDDLVIHLGDVTMIRDRFHRQARAIEIIDKLPGRKILIRGNHDHPRMVERLKDNGWQVFSSIVVSNVLFVHIPPLIKSHDVIIHGHTHGRDDPKEGYYDVGVDTNPSYAPTPLNDTLCLDDDQYKLFVKELISKLCHKTIQNTTYMCGENDNFCSVQCLEASKL